MCNCYRDFVYIFQQKLTLTEPVFEAIAQLISFEDMKTVALQYLDFKAPRVKDLSYRYSDNLDSFKVEILLQWRNETYENTQEVGII